MKLTHRNIYYNRSVAYNVPSKSFK